VALFTLDVMRTRHLWVLPLSFFALLVLLNAPAHLLAQTDLGALKGHVQDQSGSAIAGATVTVSNPSTAFGRAASTGATGNFAFAGIPLTGQYVVSVSAPQFKTVEKSGIQLRAATTATVDFALDVAGDKHEVSVYSTSESLPTESNQVSMRLDLTKIQHTPILNNKISSLPLLNSWVRPSQTTGDLLLNETLYVINGNGRRQTTYQLDNTDADDSCSEHQQCLSSPRAKRSVRPIPTTSEAPASTIHRACHRVLKQPRSV